MVSGFSYAGVDFVDLRDPSQEYAKAKTAYRHVVGANLMGVSGVVACGLASGTQLPTVAMLATVSGQPVGAFTAYNLVPVGVVSGVLQVEASPFPALPNPLSPAWFQFYVELLWAGLNATFIMDGQPLRITAWNVQAPLAPLAPDFPLALSLSGHDWFRAVGGQVEYHPNTLLAARFTISGA